MLDFGDKCGNYNAYNNSLFFYVKPKCDLREVLNIEHDSKSSRLSKKSKDATATAFIQKVLPV